MSYIIDNNRLLFSTVHNVHVEGYNAIGLLPLSYERFFYDLYLLSIQTNIINQRKQTYVIFENVSTKSCQDSQMMPRAGI